MGYFLNTNNSNEMLATAAVGPETTLIGSKLGLFDSPTPAPQGEAANLADASLSYYETNILPLQQQALRYAASPNTVAENVKQAEADVSSQFGRLPAAYARDAAATGAIASPTYGAQLASFKKTSAIEQGQATAAAANQTRAATVAAQNAAIGVA